MSTSLVLTVIGIDRPGIVSSLAETIATYDGSWMESRIARLAGRFTCILRVRVPDARAGDLTAALVAEDSQGLSIIVDRVTAEESTEGYRALVLNLIGQDRPGIVREVSQALARVDANIDEMDTEVIDASMSGETLFQANARVRISKDVPINELRGVLEELADELMVDITLEEPPVSA